MPRPKKDSGAQPSSIISDLITTMNSVGGGSKAYAQAEHEQVTCGVQIPYLAFQYLIGGSTILPIQRLFGVSGLPKSMKSTLIVEIGNWYIDAGGVHVMIDNESKTSPEMLNSMARRHRDKMNRYKERRVFKETMSVDEWQKQLSAVKKQVLDVSAQPKGSRIPWLVSIDSLTGKSTEDTQNKIAEEGAAPTRDFPAEALKISRYLDSFNLLGTSMNVAYVQHLKQDLSAPPGYTGPKYREKGAVAAAFSTSLHLRVKKGASVRMASQPTAVEGPPVDGYKLYLETTRACTGPDGRELEVEFLWQHIPVPGTEGEEFPETEQVSWFDWYGALGRLLFNMKYNDKWDTYQYDTDRLDKHLLFTKAGKEAVNCKELKLEDAHVSVFGKAIEENPEVRERIRKFLNIKQFPDLQQADLELGDLTGDE